MKSTQYRLDAHPGFELNIKNNPISMIKAKHNIMHENMIYQYPLVSITDALN